MSSTDRNANNPGEFRSAESWLVSAGRDRRPGSPLNIPPIPASNFVLGESRAYSRDDGTRSWEALEEIVGGLDGGSSLAFASGMAAIFDQRPRIPSLHYRTIAARASPGWPKPDSSAADGPFVAYPLPKGARGWTSAMSPT